MTDFKNILSRLADGHRLARDESQRAFDAMLCDAVSDVQAGAFLMALLIRGESLDEIIGAVSSLRSKMVTVDAPINAMDVVGTGGDHSGSYNVSTLAALITASCGVPVAKHGNRSASSRSGAADVLSALGVNLAADPVHLSRCLEQAGICFMFAQNHHASMRHVAGVRREMGLRTIFNLVGPLSNPAGVKRQLLGVYNEKWLEPLTKALSELGSERVWAVHGSDGLDEITTTGPTSVVALENGQIRRFTLDPRDYGIALSDPESLKGSEPDENAQALRDVLEGRKNAYRDIALLNAAAALVIAEQAEDLSEGLSTAASALDQGKTHETLEKLITVSNEVIS